MQLMGAYRLNEFYKSIRQYFYDIWNNIYYNTKNCHYYYPISSIKSRVYIKIGENTKIGRFSIIAAHSKYNQQIFNPQINIGKNTVISDYVNITCINKIIIGDGVGIGRWVTITDNFHGSQTREESEMSHKSRPLNSKGDVVIGNNVWIGDKTTILPNVHIGNGCVIGSNSVVTKDFPDNCIIGGIPAKIIKVIN